ncbi:MAG: glycosyltransferase family 4 protein, partial [Kiritimatiellia bacterium]|nr:glycosyltransferase family 4 protein [Kiritimatiellia bacterium]
FGVVTAAAAVHPDRTLLIPCLHDEPFAYSSVIREMFDAVRGCLFNGEPERDLAHRLYHYAPSRGRVVGMGLDPFEVDSKAFAKDRKLQFSYVFYAGRREDGKSTPLLVDYVDAFRRRTGRDIRLVSCGSGRIEGRPFVLDLGFVSEQVKREAMAGAAVFAHPSRMESLSIVLLESFLAGTPGLVRAQCETLRWQCSRSGGGLWWRWYPDFEEELIRLLDDSGLRDTLGRQGREFVQREYAWPAVESRLLDAVDHL